MSRIDPISWLQELIASLMRHSPYYNATPLTGSRHATAQALSPVFWSLRSPSTTAFHR